MVKTMIICLVLVSGLFSQDAYERHCVECHKELPTSLQRIFMRYLLVYSGEHNVKAGLKHYLKHPLRDISVMSDLFLDNYGPIAQLVEHLTCTQGVKGSIPFGGLPE